MVDIKKEEDPTKQPLSTFRPEMKLFRGPDESDGSPTFNLFDPVHNKYYKMNWKQSLIFQFLRPGMSAEKLTEEINSNTTVHFEVDEVMMFFRWASHFGLLRVYKGSDRLMEEVEKKKVNPIKWLLLHYLFIRIPVFNPDKFLASTMHLVKPFASKIAFAIYFILTVAAVAMLIPRFDEYLATFTYFFSFEGLIFFAAGIIFVKIVHEFAHAYTAKYYGIYVPTIGIAFLVLFPVLFTDVTHGWQLRNRKHRLAISAAGVISEIILAGLATLGWLLTNPGMLNSILFIMSSTSWITSLLFNLNPALKFDGYHLLADLWGIDNLQSRAFTVTRWKLRSWLLGLKVAPPEEGLSKSRIAGMMIYSIYTWIYRIFLYTAIALFVYFKFTKTVGIILFLTEILVFFIYPIIWELKELKALKNYFTTNPRILITSSIALIAILWFVIPIPHTETFPAIIAPIEEQILYVPHSAKIEELLVKRNDQVKNSQTMIRLTSVPIDNEIAKQQIETNLLRTQVQIIGQSDKYRRLLGQKVAELAKAEEKLKGLTKLRQELTMKAELSGTVIDWDDELKAGQFLKENQVLGRVANPQERKIVLYVPERYLSYLYEGQSMTFTIKQPYEKFEGTIKKIEPVRAQSLEYPELASDFGGDLPTVADKEGNFRIIESYFPVEAVITEDLSDRKALLRYGMRGDVTITGPWRSKLMELIRTIQRVLYRESGA